MNIAALERFSGPVPGAALLVAKNGAIALAEARGLANLETSEPCSLNTNLRLASLSKQFTAMAVLILIERGLLHFDDPLSKFFPAWRGPAASATIKQLLTHTSGLHDFEDLIPPNRATPLLDFDVLELVMPQPPDFPPGSQFRYSNSAYVMLGLIVAAVSQKSFAEFLRAEIFQPLAMANTVAFEAGLSTVTHRALGYTMTSNGPILTDQDLTSSTLGDGGIYSSITDLFLWDQALSNHRLINPDLLHKAFTPWSETSDFPGNGYGYGWYLTERHGLECQWHYGSTCGFSTWIERYPARQFTVILLANRRDAALAEIAAQIVADFLQ